METVGIVFLVMAALAAVWLLWQWAFEEWE